MSECVRVCVHNIEYFSTHMNYVTSCLLVRTCYMYVGVDGQLYSFVYRPPTDRSMLVLFMPCFWGDGERVNQPARHHTICASCCGMTLGFIHDVR